MKLFVFIIISLASALSIAGPSNFSAAKSELRQYVYFDQNNNGTLYCGCKWSWAGASGGIPSLESCGYEIATQPERAKRLEWEHIMPASNFGRARKCWQDGGRSKCAAIDSVFRTMEADMHNLAPSIGEVNADRSNFNYGALTTTSRKYGKCDFKVDFKARTAEPRNVVKGRLARTYFYMSDRYRIKLSKQQQQLFMAWHKAYPVTEVERLIESRTAERIGHHNKFVTGEVQWSIGHTTSGEGLVKQIDLKQSRPVHKNKVGQLVSTNTVRGNRRSKIYHLATGCPGYSKIAEHNIVDFPDEQVARTAGYRKAGNCRL